MCASTRVRDCARCVQTRRTCVKQKQIEFLSCNKSRSPHDAVREAPARTDDCLHDYLRSSAVHRHRTRPPAKVLSRRTTHSVLQSHLPTVRLPIPARCGPSFHTQLTVRLLYPTKAARAAKSDPINRSERHHLEFGYAPLTPRGSSVITVARGDTDVAERRLRPNNDSL